MSSITVRPNDGPAYVVKDADAGRVFTLTLEDENGNTSFAYVFGERLERAWKAWTGTAQRSLAENAAWGAVLEAAQDAYGVDSDGNDLQVTDVRCTFGEW